LLLASLSAFRIGLRVLLLCKHVVANELFFETGIKSATLHLPASITEDELLTHVHRLNGDTDIDGILVQLPLPAHINERRVCNAVMPQKDVDGFHVANIGRVCIDQPALVPATSAAVLEIIKRTGLFSILTLSIISCCHVVGCGHHLHKNIYTVLWLWHRLLACIQPLA